MKQLLPYIILFFTTLSSYGQSKALQPEHLYSSKMGNRVEEGYGYKFENERITKSENEISIYYLTKVDASLNCELEIKVLRFDYDRLKNEVRLEGYVKGGRKNLSGVQIFVGSLSDRIDTLNMASPMKFERDKPLAVKGSYLKYTYTPEPTPFIIRYKVLNASYSFKTPDAQLVDRIGRPFKLTFAIRENDVIAFGLDGCNAQIFEIGKTSKQPTTE